MSTIIVPIIKSLLSDTFINIFGRRGNDRVVYKDTLLIKEKIIPDLICDQIATRIDNLLDGVIPCKHIWSDELGADKRIYGFEKYMDDELLSHFDIGARLISIKRYLGIAAPYWFLMANRITAISGNSGSGGGFHRDSPYSHQMKYIWYLSDVGYDNGPFSFIPNTHRKSISSRKQYPLGQTRFDSITADSLIVAASKGSMLACDTKCIHGGAPLINGSRYAVTLYSFSTKARMLDVFKKLDMNHEAM